MSLCVCVCVCVCVQDKGHLTAISSLQKDIMQHLPNYYHTFVDVMEFRDVTNEVITSVATSQFIFDIVSLDCVVVVVFVFVCVSELVFILVYV